MLYYLGERYVKTGNRQTTKAIIGNIDMSNIY